MVTTDNVRDMAIDEVSVSELESALA
ncbi:MAG: hypothetical protein JWM12_699, partial [Ilumatobacteraceae bacterium]|nr:hypothetical protein [Ilumatobacteraceae bacterium]